MATVRDRQLGGADRRPRAPGAGSLSDSGMPGTGRQAPPRVGAALLAAVLICGVTALTALHADAQAPPPTEQPATMSSTLAVPEPPGPPQP